MKESLGRGEKQIPVSSVVHNNQAGVTVSVTCASRCPSLGKDSAQKPPYCLLLFDITERFLKKKIPTPHIHYFYELQTVTGQNFPLKGSSVCSGDSKGSISS